MVEDLLDLSRLNAGALPMHIEVNAVDDLLVALLQRVEPSFPTHRLDVVTDPPGQLFFGRFDFLSALRILVNVVENAVRYSPRGSAIEVVVASSGGELIIDVMDRGPGIPEEQRDAIFDEFHTIARPGEKHGSGLGLAIAKRLALAQNGRIEYLPRPGGGSVFRLRLPAVSPSDFVLRPKNSTGP